MRRAHKSTFRLEGRKKIAKIIINLMLGWKHSTVPVKFPL